LSDNYYQIEIDKFAVYSGSEFVTYYYRPIINYLDSGSHKLMILGRQNIIFQIPNYTAELHKLRFIPYHYLFKYVNFLTL